MRRSAYDRFACALARRHRCDGTMQTPKTRRERQEELIDEALEESFPASDPISPAVGPGEPAEGDEAEDDAD